MKQIIISGGNFVNKGAEAMLFITTNECFNRFKGCVCVAQLPQGFFEIRSLEELYALSQNSIAKPQVQGKMGKLKQMLKTYQDADLMIDISGYELCSKLGNYPSLRYLFKIALSKLMRTKVVLMPQSYGPFDYQGKFKLIIPYMIRRYLKYPVICFAREKESEEYLKKAAPKATIQLSTDLVLQNNTILAEISSLTDIPSIDIPKHSVGLVVNRRLYEQYDEKNVNEYYHIVIEELLNCGKRIFLLCHASDDLSICEEIKDAFSGEERVVMLDSVLSCFAFQKMAKSFDYVIAARYHSIVHAYKECIPCIAFGWAAKYQELLKIMGQEEYLVQINSSSSQEIIDIIRRMDKAALEEKKTIEDCLKKIQKTNCFDMMESVVRN